MRPSGRFFTTFPTVPTISSAQWEAYSRVNQRFFEELKPHIEAGDTVWVHDYQLMLLPRLIKESYPEVSVGFFLHIPFPSYEIMRLMPWREEIMAGLWDRICWVFIPMTMCATLSHPPDGSWATSTALGI